MLDTTVTPEMEAALQADLEYVSDTEPGIRRQGRGRGFFYTASDGKTVRDGTTLDRIRMLAIPPAWTDVWISINPNGHVQATGRDARGRKQYRYHNRWAEARGQTKYDRLVDVAHMLPALRAQIENDLARPSPSKARVLATVVHLLESTLIRIGNREYAATNDSYGLTTLRDEHVQVTGTRLLFEFRGKSGKTWQLGIKDRRIARTVRLCQELPGQHLFQYVEAGERYAITSTEVNAYLREATRHDISAKDIRTWAGTVLAATTLAQADPPQNASHAKKIITAAIKQVAARLGNTPAVARKAYVHPEVLEAYLDGQLPAAFILPKRKNDWLRPDERAVLSILELRSSSVSGQPSRSRKVGRKKVGGDRARRALVGRRADR